MELPPSARSFVLFIALMLGSRLCAAELPPSWKDGKFEWQATGPLLDAGKGRAAADPHVSIKDPSIVFHEGRWHLFATVLTRAVNVQIEYFNFADWPEAASAERTILPLGDKLYAAPQVFYFTPHRRWYLICQTEENVQPRTFRASFSTTETLADPKSWTKMEPVLPLNPPGKVWLDFWVICDAQKAHMFYTTLEGRIWRRETLLADFPRGWSEPTLAVQGKLWEASHTYKLKGRNDYLMLIEAMIPGRRYYKAYLADRLEGPWRGLADSLAKPFAARENVRQSPEWTASISHGELLRSGVDEHLEVDPENLQFLFQGVTEADYRGAKYSDIPWRLGILRPVR
jgi:hypothetical protein